MAKKNMGIINKITSEGLLIIGDVHGKVDNYWKILQKHDGASIQLGDFGFNKHHKWHLKNIDNKKHQIVFGNHDDYTFVNKPHSLRNWAYTPQGYEIMTIRGAWSIDKHDRVEGKSWWANEELTYTEMEEAVDAFNYYKPKIVITHNCPYSVGDYLFGIKDKSMTCNGFEIMLQNHQPDLWFFGHHHRSVNEEINGTRFICLAELETYLLK
jgi:predicted phosphodiesterase